MPITTFISLIGFLISVFALCVLVLNLRFNAASATRNQHKNVLFDIDRQLISRPELWAIYDDHEMVSCGPSNCESKARREAFLHLYFNLFEMVYNDFHRQLGWRTHSEELWRSWDAWIREFFKRSTEARDRFGKAAAAKIYSEAFTQYARKAIEHPTCEQKLKRVGWRALLRS